MKIDKIYISAFGKFKDYTIDFTDGLNIVYGENENGKSTIMAFIKMMFYGSGRNIASIAKNPRIKYNPWSGEKMAGKIFFEHNNTKYCLEREFFKSDSTDKVRLTNLDTGETNSVSSTVGLDFFSLSLPAFEKTVFIGQIGVFDSNENANDEINSKLSNMALTGDEDISFKTVFSRLTNAKQKLMSKSGKSGIYDKGLAKLQEEKNLLNDAFLKQNKRKEILDRIEQIKKETLRLSKEYKNAQKIQESENDIKNFKKLEDYLLEKSKLDALNEEIKLANGTLCDDAFIKKVEFLLSKLENAILRLKERKKEAEILKKEINLYQNKSNDEINENKRSYEQNILKSKERLEGIKKEISVLEDTLKNKLSLSKTVHKKPLSLPLLVVSVLSLLLAIISFTVFPAFVSISSLSTYLGIAFSLFTFVFLLLSFILKPIDTDFSNRLSLELLNIQTEISALKSTESEINKEILENTEKIVSIDNLLNTDKADIERKIINLSELNNQILNEESSCNNLEKETFELFSLYKNVLDIEEITALMPKIKEKAEQQKQIKLKLKYIADDLGGISYDKAEEKIKAIKENADITNIDFEENKLFLEKITNDITELKSEFSALNTELKTAYQNFETPEVIKKRIEDIKATLDSQKYFCEISDIASCVLETSFAEVRRSYGSVLENKALDIFKKLTDGKYAAFKVSKAFDITVEEAENFGTREVDYLSSGTADQAYLSLKLAITELILNGEKLPIFLDDILTQYDDSRAKTALDFLKEYSKDSQAILFTCHKSIIDYANTVSITTKNV